MALLFSALIFVQGWHIEPETSKENTTSRPLWARATLPAAAIVMFWKPSTRIRVVGITAVDETVTMVLLLVMLMTGVATVAPMAPFGKFALKKASASDLTLLLFGSLAVCSALPPAKAAASMASESRALIR
jgi:hypothetical protein